MTLPCRAGDVAALGALLARAPAYRDVFVVPYGRNEGGGFQLRGGRVLAVVHDPDLLALLDHLWRGADGADHPEN